MREMFKNKIFARYFIADSLAKLADNFFFLYITWLALQQTGSPAYAGAILMTNAIPRLVFMIFGGSLADKIPPQVILRAGNIAQALGLGVILFALVSNSLSLPLLFVIAGLFGLVDAFSSPASMSAMPRIVPKNMLLKANSLVQGGEMFIFMAGSLLAGIVLQFDDMKIATFVNFAIYAISAVMFFTVKLKFDKSQQNETGSEFKKIVSGIKYAWKKPIIRANILLLAATNIAISGPVSIGLLLLVTDTLSLTPIYYSIVSATFAIGALLGAVAASRIKKINAPGRLVIASYILDGLGLIGIGIAHNIWVIALITIVMGLVGGVAGAINSTLIQSSTKISMLGRISALTMIAALAFDPVSQGLTGIIAEWSIEGTMVIAGAFMILATLMVVPFNKILLSRTAIRLNTGYEDVDFDQ